MIDELQSNYGESDESGEEEVRTDGAHAGQRVVPEKDLSTDPAYGLTSDEVARRRKKYGLNQMAEENESLIIKFLMFFVGPIQFVMEAAEMCIRDRYIGKLFVIPSFLHRSISDFFSRGNLT